MTTMLVTAMIAGSPITIDATPSVVDRTRYIGWVDRRRRVVRPYRWTLKRIAWCESTGRWHIATGNGFYGGLQFTLSSWRAVGGRGYPHYASKLEQMFRAVRLMRLQGWGAWPNCA
jgi:hypothetical protein